MIGWIAFWASVMLVLSNLFNVGINTQEQCNATAYVVIGLIGTILSVAYMTGGLR